MMRNGKNVWASTTIKRMKTNGKMIDPYYIRVSHK
jgi:hypothetical protein